MDFVGCEWENFTRFVSTRWLSLETCCDKEFKKIEALKSMFISRGEKEGQLDIMMVQRVRYIKCRGS